MDETRRTTARPAHDLTPVVDLTLPHGAGPFRTRLPHYVSLLPPCNHACPAGENIQAWLALAQAGDYRQAWETLMARQPAAGDAWPGLLSPVRNGLQPRRAGLPRCRSTRSSASSATWRRAKAGRMPVAPATGRRILVVGAGPSGLSAAYHLTRLGHQVEIHEAGPLPGGMLHFGIPAYRLPRADLLAEIARIERDGRADRAQPQGRRRRRRNARPAASTRCSSRSARMSASTPTSRRATRCGCWMPWRCCATTSTGDAPMLGPARRGLWRRQHRDGRRPHRPPPRRRGGAHRLPPRPRAHAGARIRSRRGAGRGREDQVADHDQGDRRSDADGRAHGARRQGPPAADRRVRNAGGRHRRAGAGPGQPTAASCATSPASSSKSTAPSWSTGSMMTGHPGMFAGGDMVPAERTVTVAVGHGKKAARYIDAWLRGRDLRQAGRSSRWSTFDMLQPAGVQRRRSGGAARIWPTSDRLSGFDEVLAGLSEPEARHEAQRCLSCGNCFECDNCFAACPEQAIVKLGPGQGYSVERRDVHRLRHVLRAMPLPRHRDGRGTVDPPHEREAPSSARRQTCSDATVDAEHRAMMDGNTAVAHVAYRVNEVCAIYPDHAVLDHGGTGRRMVGRRASRTSGATSRWCRRCRARAAPPARCTARCSPAR